MIFEKKKSKKDIIKSNVPIPNSLRTRLHSTCLRTADTNLSSEPLTKVLISEGGREEGRQAGEEGR